MVEKQNEQKMEGFSTEFLQETMMHMVKVLGEPAKEYKDRVFRMLLKIIRFTLTFTMKECFCMGQHNME